MSNDGSLLTSGGIIAVVTAITALITVITKYLLERRKLDNDDEAKLIMRLENRIIELERVNSELIDRLHTQAQEIGYLNGRLENGGLPK